jgi:hypothetical protein
LKIATRLLLMVVVFASLYAGVSRLAGFSADGDWRNQAHRFLFEARRTEALYRRGAQMSQSAEVKRAITNEVIAGRLTLREAAKQFEAADKVIEAAHEGMVASYRVPHTEEERCRQVIGWVRNVLSERYSSSEIEPVLHRLEKELQTEFPPTKSAITTKFGA